ncbi:hypothetical protein, partial [Nocardioides bruguierae]
MAVRRESVLLELEDHFTTGMAKAAAATAALNRNLHDLDGTSTSTSGSVADLDRSISESSVSTERARAKTSEYTLEMARADVKSRELRKTLREQALAELQAADGADELGDSLNRSGRDIDRYSGRLRLLGEAIVILGPTLSPIAASLVPAVTGLTAGLGAAAAGAATAMIAVQGLGDAVTALDDFQNDPTEATLEKLQETLYKLGPETQHFVRYLNALQPVLAQIRDTAGAGLFPGVESALDRLQTDVPAVTSFVSDLAATLGRLADDAAAALVGDDMEAFISYVRSDTVPMMDSWARSTGNVVVGLGQLMAGLAPLSRDFTFGFEDM